MLMGRLHFLLPEQQRQKHTLATLENRVVAKSQGLDRQDSWFCGGNSCALRQRVTQVRIRGRDSVFSFPLVLRPTFVSPLRKL